MDEAKKELKKETTRIQRPRRPEKIECPGNENEYTFNKMAHCYLQKHPEIYEIPNCEFIIHAYALAEEEWDAKADLQYAQDLKKYEEDLAVYEKTPVYIAYIERCANLIDRYVDLKRTEEINKKIDVLIKEKELDQYTEEKNFISLIQKERICLNILIAKDWEPCNIFE